jgi:hypothetical protein
MKSSLDNYGLISKTKNGTTHEVRGTRIEKKTRGLENRPEE